jgi:hypothetical protein
LAPDLTNDFVPEGIFLVQALFFSAFFSFACLLGMGWAGFFSGPGRARASYFKLGLFGLEKLTK